LLSCIFKRENTLLICHGCAVISTFFFVFLLNWVQILLFLPDYVLCSPQILHKTQPIDGNALSAQDKKICQKKSAEEIIGQAQDPF